MALQEDVLCGLVGDDDLAADEEEVLEAVVAWIKRGADEGRGESLLREVRYGLMEASRLGELAQRAGGILAGRQGARLRDLALESLAVQLKPVDERGRLGGGLMGGKTFVERVGPDVAWGDYARGRWQHRVVREERDVSGLFACDGRIFGALADGSVLAWDQSTLEERQCLRSEGEVASALCVTVCGDLAISGHSDGSVRGWNIATGGCDHVIQGHDAAVECVVTWEQYLVTGSDDHTIKIWQVGGTGSWLCLGTITVHNDEVWAMVVWQGRAISGSKDDKVCVSSIVSRELETTLDGHTDPVSALVVYRGKLLSTGWDNTIRVWALDTWEQVRVVCVSEHVPEVLSCLCLAISGSKLLCGGQLEQDDDARDEDDGDDAKEGFLLVLDYEAMSCEHTLIFDYAQHFLLRLRGEVWCRMHEGPVVVWGNAEREKGGQGA